MPKEKPPVSLLWEKYAYNPLTGRFHCPVDDYEFRGNHCRHSHQLSISGAHRYPYGVCVFAWIKGRWPKPGMQIDHINRDPFNHRHWSIRQVTPEENLRNRDLSNVGKSKNRKPRAKPTKTKNPKVGAGRWRKSFQSPRAS
jgi:hypothetical protein